jgi:hypothetical protein
MPGRAMKDYWVMPLRLVSDPSHLRRLATSAAQYTRSLVPKVKKALKSPARKKQK